jgi:hypothetical protein
MNDSPQQPVEMGTTRQAVIDNLQAQALSVEESAIRSLQAETVVTHLSAAGQVQAAHADVQASAVGALNGQQATLRTVLAGVLYSARSTLSRSLVGFIVGEQVTVTDRSFVGIVITPKWQGETRPLVDLRGAMMIGLVIGLVLKLTAFSNTKPEQAK